VVRVGLTLYDADGLGDDVADILDVPVNEELPEIVGFANTPLIRNPTNSNTRFILLLLYIIANYSFKLSIF
jgi:hypothetical protein